MKKRIGRTIKRNALDPITSGIIAQHGMAFVSKMMKSKNKGLKSKFAKLFAKKNPSKADLEEVEEMSRQFHGREPKEILDVDEVESFDPNQAMIGELEELGVLNSDMSQWLITFKKNRPMLTCDGKGENLEIIGGDQELEIEDGKRKVSLGYAYSIVYETDKHHLEGSNGYPEPYEHFFGEEYYRSNGYEVDDRGGDVFFEKVMAMGLVLKAIEKGYLPVVVYDKVDAKILLVGGKYKVEDVGIKD